MKTLEQLAEECPRAGDRLITASAAATASGDAFSAALAMSAAIAEARAEVARISAEIDDFLRRDMSKCDGEYCVECFFADKTQHDGAACNTPTPRHVFIEGIAMHGMTTDEAYTEFMSQGSTIKSFTSFGTSHPEFRTDQV